MRCNTSIRTPLYALIFFCVAWLNSSAQVGEYIIEEPISSLIEVSDHLEVWVDTSGTTSITDLLSNDGIQFSAFEPSEEPFQFPLVVWHKLRVINATDADVNAVLTFYHLVDTIEMFVTTEGVVHHHALTGTAFKPGDKPILSTNNSLLFSIQANADQTLYVRHTFLNSIAHKHFAKLYIRGTEVLYGELMYKYSGQSFYAGLMLMFALLSFFGWMLTRDMSFVYFSFVHLAFTFYFLVITNTFGAFVLHVQMNSIFTVQSISISLLILSLFVFISHYLSLPKHLPRHYRVVLIITLVTMVHKYVHMWLTEQEMVAVLINNALILIWLVVIVSAIVRLAYRKHPAAVNLLVSLTILILTAAIYVLALSGVISKSFLTMHSIQLGSILFSLLVFYRLFEAVRDIEQERQRALTINEVKSRFFTNLSHEFRTPLTLIMAPLDRVIETNTDPEQRKLITLARKHADRLLNMINQLLDIARIEGDEVKLNVEEVNIVPFTKGILMSFESMATLKGITLAFSSSSDHIPAWVDTEKVEVIMYNLLSNALKYTPDGGRVSVDLRAHHDQIEIRVRDTGEGIPAHLLPYIFDRFFRIESSGADGNGIGLCLSKELTELHHGTLTAESTVGKGTTLIVSMKRGKVHFESSDAVEWERDAGSRRINTQANLAILENELLTDDGDDRIQQKPTSFGSKPVVLLVEDNADVRSFIRSQLIDRFNIIEAVEGKAGFEQAIEHAPELIISDVMMPGMNGIDLCKALKSDVRTSHIPVILLTAKTEQEHRMEGLEAGADDYLHKPFYAKELNLRVGKLIELRVQLKQRLLESPTLAFTSVDGNQVENTFLEQLTGYIDEHLSDTQFSVAHLADFVKMSVPQLNRKLRSITGLTAVKFVQHVRLNKALLLLETEDVNVSEVAHLTGFSSTAYFVKSFREHYGKTPGTVLKAE